LFTLFKKKKVDVEFNPQTAISLLVELTDILERNSIQSWLTDGTLLGFYRESNFIGHDKDMDIGAFIKNYNPAIKEVIREYGWTLIRELGTVEQGLEFTLGKNSHKIDIFFFYEDKEKYWHAAWQGKKIDGKRYRAMIKYNYDRFELKKAMFLGHEFNVPSDTKKYIITKYGEGWHTPVKDWDWTFGPSNAEATDIIVPEKKKRKQ
jgi:hypothetical protein